MRRLCTTKHRKARGPSNGCVRSERAAPVRLSDDWTAAPCVLQVSASLRERAQRSARRQSANSRPATHAQTGPAAAFAAPRASLRGELSPRQREAALCIDDARRILGTFRLAARLSQCLRSRSLSVSGCVMGQGRGALSSPCAIVSATASALLHSLAARCRFDTWTSDRGRSSRRWSSP